MKAIKILSVCALCAAAVWAQDPPTANKVGTATRPTADLRDNSINAGQTRILSRDTIYIIREKVFVEDGGVLVIEPGTVIKGASGTGEASTALIICMGGKIIADGTRDQPIVFTAITDDLNGSLTSDDKSQWGGIVLLGKATTNNGEAGFSVEGIAVGDPRTRGGIGGIDDDSSGVLRYVSIRHAGIEIAADNELNSLSMVGVGSRTVLDYIEAFACGDDGFEWWGGTVSGRHMIVAFGDDDGFDIDLGFRGKLQFIFVIQDSVAANMKANWAGEWDGDDTRAATPWGMHQIANATFIGGGSTANTSNACIIMRANAGGKVYNSIFTDFKRNRGVVIEDNSDPAVQTARKRFEAGDIAFYNNLFWNVGGAAGLDSILRWSMSVSGSTQYLPSPEMVAAFTAANNQYINPMLSSVAWTPGAQKLDPRARVRLSGGGVAPAYADLATLPADPFFEAVPFKGAFGEVNWAKGWTALDQYGYFGELNNDDVVATAPRRTRIGAAPAAALVRLAGNTLTVSRTAADVGAMTVAVRDLFGRTRAAQSVAAVKGANSVTLDVSGFSNGLYVVETALNGSVATNQIWIAR